MPDLKDWALAPRIPKLCTYYRGIHSWCLRPVNTDGRWCEKHYNRTMMKKLHPNG